MTVPTLKITRQELQSFIRNSSIVRKFELLFRQVEELYGQASPLYTLRSRDDLPPADVNGDITVPSGRYECLGLIDIGDASIVMPVDGMEIFGTHGGQLFSYNGYGIVNNSSTRPTIKVAEACDTLNVHNCRIQNKGTGPVIHCEAAGSLYNLIIEQAGILAGGAGGGGGTPGSIGTIDSDFLYIHRSLVAGFSDGILMRSVASAWAFEQSTTFPAGSGGYCFDMDASTVQNFRIVSATIWTVSGGYGVVGADSNIANGFINMNQTAFLGSGTALGGSLTPFLIGVDIQNCTGIKNSSTIGQVAMANNASATSCPSNVTYYDLAGTSVLDNTCAPRFDNGGANNTTVRYLGKSKNVVLVNVSVRFSKSGALRYFNLRLTKNGSQVGDVHRFGIANENKTVNFVHIESDINQNDSFSLQINSETAGSSITAQDASITLNFKS